MNVVNLDEIEVKVQLDEDEVEQVGDPLFIKTKQLDYNIVANVIPSLSRTFLNKNLCEQWDRALNDNIDMHLLKKLNIVEQEQGFDFDKMISVNDTLKH